MLTNSCHSIIGNTCGKIIPKEKVKVIMIKLLKRFNNNRKLLRALPADSDAIIMESSKTVQNALFN